MSAIGTRIKDRRLELKMTQDALCQKVDISKGFLSDLENGNRGVSATNLHNIAKALGVSLEFLMTGKDERKSSAPVNIPDGLSALAQKENMSFNTILMLLDMRQQILAHRSSIKTVKDNDFEWDKFYDSVKEWLPNG
ncbi:MAG: helix-turn-helix transcriptional regulator [Kiritimatiellales bacterium]